MLIYLFYFNCLMNHLRRIEFLEWDVSSANISIGTIFTTYLFNENGNIKIFITHM